MHSYHFRLAALALLLALFLAACSTQDAQLPTHQDDGLAVQSHFRQSTLTFTRTGPTGVAFTLVSSWRRSAYACVNPLTGASVSCSAPDGRPGAGDYIYERVGGTQLGFGDGTFTPTLYYRVDAIDVAGDWLLGTALEPGTTNPTIPKTYANAGPFTAFLATCCRISNSVNAPNGSYVIESLVDLTGSNTGNPVSSLPAVVDCPANALCTFAVPAADPDGDAIAFRLSTAAESGIPEQPGPPHAPNAASIAAATGIYSWDTTGAAGGVGALYATQVTLEARNSSGALTGKTAVDFLIRLVDATANTPPEFHSPPTPASGSNLTVSVGDTLSFTVEAHDHDAGDTVTVGHLGLPSGASLVCGSPAMMVSCTFSWTPAAAQVGVYAVTFTAQDSRAANAFHGLTITVQQGTTPPPPPDPGDQGCSPGFWRNRAVTIGAWADAGYASGTALGATFDMGMMGGLSSRTLLQTLAFRGGSGVSGAAQILLQAAVAALLNAAHPEVAYPMSKSEVLSAVNAALTRQSGESDGAWRSRMLALATQLDGYNNLGCPLGD